MESLKHDVELNCSGMLHPMPVIKTSKAIKEISIGQILKVIVTDPGTPPEMAAWAKQTGQELLDSRKENQLFIFFIKRVK